MHRFTIEQKSFILENAKGLTNAELTDIFNRKFETDLKASQIKAYKSNHAISSGLDGRFKKGQVSANKGKKMSREQYEKCKHTMFKKGKRPVNYRPVGSERVNVDGYVEIKVADPGVWKLKHRVLFEQLHGKIPEGKNIIFADGNSLNLSADNLVMVGKEELVRLNQKHAIAKDADITKTAINLVRLKELIRKKKRGK